MPSPLSTLIYCFSEYESIIEQLSMKGVISPSLWITSGADREKIVVSDIVFDKVGVLKYKYHIPLDMYQKIHDTYFIVFLSHVSRQDSYLGSHTTPWECRFLFRRLVCLAYDLILQNRIELFISNAIPHEIFDIILFAVAKEINIHTIYLISPSYVENCFFILNEYKEIGLYKNRKKVSRDIHVTPETFGFNSLPQPMVKYIKNEREETAISENNIHSLYNRQLLFRYRQNLLDFTSYDPLPEQYAYFALHFQPEATNVAQAAPIFDDQLVAVEYLAQMLPAGMPLLIKENPLQSFYYRNDLFFKRLSEIPNTRLVPVDYSSRKLVAGARLVGSLVGSCGWEALALGKPVITFGYALYRELPGVFTYSPELKIEDVLNYTFDPEALQQEIDTLFSTAYPGCTSIERKPEDPVKNTEKVCSALQKYISSFWIRHPLYRKTIQSEIDKLRKFH